MTGSILMLEADEIDGITYEREAPIACPHCGVMNNGRVIEARFGMKVSVVECPCGLAYQSPRPSEEASIAYMNWRWGSSNGSYVSDLDAKRTVARNQLKVLADLGRTGGRLLDFGAGNGTFVGEARARGFEAVGVERSDAARESARGRGVDLLESLPPDSAPFDMICLWDVVEHLREPQEIVTDLVDRLKPKGVMVLETGNWNSWRRTATGDSWSLYLLDHQFYFTPSSLERLLSLAGLTNFRVVATDPGRPPARRLARTPITTAREWIAFVKARRSSESACNVMTVAGYKSGD